MSRQIIIQFQTRALKEAKQLAKDIAKQVSQVARNIKDVNVRRAFRQDQRQQAEERKAATEAEARRLRLERESAALRGRSWGVGHNPALRAAKEGQESIRALGRNLAAGNLGAVMSSLGSGAGGLFTALGPVAGLAGVVMTIVMPELERREARANAARDAEITAQVQRAIADADIEGRLKRDPLYRRKFEAQAANLFVETRRAAARGGWHPRSARVLEGF